MRDGKYEQQLWRWPLHLLEILGYSISSARSWRYLVSDHRLVIAFLNHDSGLVRSCKLSEFEHPILIPENKYHAVATADALGPLSTTKFAEKKSVIRSRNTFTAHSDPLRDIPPHSSLASIEDLL